MNRATKVGDTEVWSLNGVRVINVHSQDACDNRCPLHSPTPHHMRDWQLGFQQETTLMTRECDHGFTHPDPDSLHFFTEMGRTGYDKHVCDGCCIPPGGAR